MWVWDLNLGPLRSLNRQSLYVLVVTFDKMRQVTSLKKKKTHSLTVFKYLFKFKNNLHGTNDFMLTTYCICRKKYIALKENVT